ncbi:class E vacuolar protein-sorting machinery protein hse1-like [Schistocerca americana]|uniref:class E vacuolar protein-sorting machinery protein hse1-like n=1 Tax=Schistocerca americana TaxID=7009 RepID=UPI001F4F350C|nr:class E vacuolar protein-sorting machinery protein hse1-like [Schistocerca americana]
MSLISILIVFCMPFLHGQFCNVTPHHQSYFLICLFAGANSYLNTCPYPHSLPAPFTCLSQTFATVLMLFIGCGVAGFPSGIQQANSLPSSYPPSGFTATAGGYRYAVPPGEHGNPAPVPAGFVDSCSSTGYRMQSQMLPPTAGSGQLWKAPSMSDLAAFSRSGANCRGPLPPSSLPLPLTAAADAPGSGTHAQAGSGPSLGHHTSHPSPQQQQPGTATSSEIDRIMAKIEQDNRILAELDKTRSTIGLSNNSSSTTAGGSVCAAGNVTSGTTVPLATQAGHGEQNTLAYVGVPSAQPYQALSAPLGTQPQYVMPVLAPAAPPGPQQQTYVPTHTARLMPQIPTAAAAATAGAAAGIPGILTTPYDLDTLFNTKELSFIDKIRLFRVLKLFTPKLHTGCNGSICARVVDRCIRVKL